MKKYIIILVSAVFLIPFAGCKKKSFDPTGKSRQDFIGTWAGSISTFKNNKLLKESGTVVIYPDAGGNTVSGILFMSTTSVFHEFQFVNGTLYFKVVNNDPANPTCQNWSLGGFAVFSDEGKIDIHITGNECGQIGSEFVNWVGTMGQSSVSADSLKILNFAKSGNSWTYKVTMKNGDSCQVQKLVSQSLADYLFVGTTAQTCGWTGQNMTFSWNVMPSEFNIVTDSTFSLKPISFPLNAKPGVVNSSYLNNDTITVTLLDTNQVITTAAGNFSCMRYRYTEPVYLNAEKITRTAYLWINNKYGIIKQEVSNPVNPTDPQFQVLTAKNF